MTIQCNSNASAAMIIPMTMAFILVCSNSQGWLWPLVGYVAMILGMGTQPAMQCRRQLFWSIAATGLLLVVVALTLKDRWQVIL